MIFLPYINGQVLANDIEGVQEHPMIERYPGQEIRWQKIENYMMYEVPISPVTGYRKIDQWINTEGLVTLTFYRLQSEERTFSEVYLNYLSALEEQNFEILASQMAPDRNGRRVGGTSWIGVAFAANPITASGAEVHTLFAGTSSQGGIGAIVAKKDRAAGTAYVVIAVEQDSKDYIGALIDIIEVQQAETGLVSVDAEAIGSNISDVRQSNIDRACV